ncbi:hypothetical protein [Massilia niastensis]|uniref:hypothetical protein n=1 Tax=Massilia niastensis TaxID=544911 RepID=UPI00036C6C5C|nr:hypothetical protein [Massilia niastensis]
MKKFFAVAAMVLAVAAPTAALAHESAAKHGGVVRTAGDLSFELVNKNGKATIYVDDHGRDLPVDGMSGKLTVLNGKEKTEVPLEAGSGNMLVAKGDAKLASGAKVVAAITFPDKSTRTIRFAIK